jgi:3-hydroxy-9,10-secoandrosta-1,3,5(10)-triene-9,17-dione monooxygenase reductase component
MAEPSSNPVNPIGQALGKIPSGLYILTVRHEGHATGMLVSWVQQAGFEPPMITAAVGTKRYVADWVASSRKFTLNQLPVGSKALIRHFGRGFAADAPAFEGVAVRDGAQGGPVLEAALSFLDAEVVGELASGDHRVFLARVVAGALINPAAEPLVHLRANGFHY